MPILSPFSFLKSGFRHRPTSFYGRPLWLRKYKLLKHYRKRCNQGRFIYKTLFDLNDQFLRRMHQNNNLPYFFMCSLGDFFF